MICLPIPLRPTLQTESISKRKKGVLTRCSPRIHHKVEEDTEESKRELSSDQGSRGNKTFLFSTVWAIKSIPGCFLENCPTEQPSCPSGEDTSDTDMVVPPDVPGIEGTEEVPSTRSSGHPNLKSVISLYNNCCSVLFCSVV